MPSEMPICAAVFHLSEGVSSRSFLEEINTASCCRLSRVLLAAAGRISAEDTCQSRFSPCLDFNLLAETI